MDYTLCKGHGCLVAERCKRFTASPSEVQSYFSDSPFRIQNGLFKCDMFWGDSADLLFTQLTELANGKEDRGNDSEGTNETKGNTGSETETDL